MAGLSSSTGNRRAPLAERGDDLYQTPPEAVRANSGMAFAWFVWDRGYLGTTVLRRLSWERDE